jgi:GT2 family glycosyltransferase
MASPSTSGAPGAGAASSAPDGTPVMRPEDVVIIVLSWNRCDDTLACLDSLKEAWFGGASAIVVDNGSRDGSVEAVRDRFPDVKVVALPENRGYAGGNNVGIRAAFDEGAQAVLLLNNDTKVAPDFLGWLVQTLNDQSRAAAVSSAVLRIDSPEVLDVAYLDVFFGHGLVHRRGVNALPGHGFDVAKPVEVGIGSSLLIRRAALERVGLLDESYFAYHEEVDWCFRARQAGYEIWYQPLSRVWHHGSRSTLAALRPRPGPRVARPKQLDNALPLTWNPVRTYLGARNAVRFVRAHGSRRQQMYFVCSTLYAVPLALLAAVLDGEEELMLGLWTYRKALVRACIGGDEGGTRLGRLLRALVRAPAALLWQLPRDIARAHRDGQTAQIEEHVHGLVDGLRDRPVPLERLGLR